MPEKFEVVISGISGRFPECDDVETFKRMLYNQENPITYDNRKWPINYKYKFGDEIVPLGTGKFLDIQRFDARVFACSAALAKCTDIINRKVLEPSFEAVMDAGINPTTLMGANVGCFMSSCINEVESIKIFTRMTGKFFIVGGSKAMCSNRVSFAMNLTGPSFTFGGGTFGGLEALAAAYQNISEGRIESAIVGGSSSVIDPKLSVNFLRLGYLSPDSLTRSFDADANGYGRSEGSVVLFLQRAQDAKRSYGTVKLSDTFYYGMNPYTFVGFNEDTIETCLKEIYGSNQNNVKPTDICFLEMDACGVKFREKQEVEAVDRIFCSGRSDSLLVGSIKSHCGHTEGAASYISLLKCLLALDSGYIAPNMHFNKPNSELKQLIDGKLKVVTQKTKLPGRMVAVNAFSFFGVTSHAVIEQHPKGAQVREGDEDDTLPRLLIFCGRTETDMKRIIDKVEAMPFNKEFVYISNDVFKMPITTHFFRGYTIIPPKPQAINAVEVCEGENRPIWFVFSGMGSQWNGMGKALLGIPIFAEAIKRCDAVLRPKGIDIYEIITSDDPNMFDNIVHAFVGIISVQVGLINILRALCIEADGIIGHSVGENACAYADGCLTLEQAVLASYARGIASNEAETIKGMMAAIGRGYDQIKDDLPEGIEVACHNSHSNCTLTGPAEIVNKFVEKLQEEKIFARAVNVSNIAYHSRHIAPAAPHLLRRLNEVITKPTERSSKWISTSVPEDKWDSLLAKTCSAEYLTNNLVNPVLFEEGCKHIPENAIVIEIAPHGLLQAILKRSLHKTCTNISMTSRSSGSNSVGYLLSSIGKMYIAGCQPDVNAIFPKIDYPVSRGTPSTASLATWDHSECWENIGPTKDRPLSEEILTVKLNEGSKLNFIKGHEIKNQKIIPTSLYLYFVWYMFATIKNEKMENQNIIFENIKVHRDLHVTLEKPRRLTLMIQYGSGDFEMLLTEKKEDEEPIVVMTGTIQIAFESKPITINREDMLSQTKKKIHGREFYKYLENIGFKLDESFARITEMTYTATECFSKIAWSDNWISFLDCLMKLHIYSGFDKNDLLFPVRIRRLEIHATEFNTLKLGDEVICQKDLVTQRLRCNGLEMVGFVHDESTISTFLDTDSSRLQIEAVHFVCYSDPQFKNKETFLRFCLELTVESLVLSTSNRDTKIRIVDTTHQSSMLEDIKRVIKQRTELKTYFTFLNSIDDIDPENASLLIFHDQYEFEKSLLKMKQSSKPLFALIISAVSKMDNSKATIPSSVVEITKQSFDDVNIHLYKKLTEKYDRVSPVINASDDWIAKLLPKLESNKSEPVTVIKRSVEPADLDIICGEQKLYSKIRYVFLLDNDAPSFSIENPFYRKQIQRELPINILKAGQWGSYRSVDSYIKYTSQYRDDPKVNYRNFRMKNVELNYVAKINKQDTLKNTILGVCNAEYSGIDASGQKIMGLGRVTVDQPKYEPDTHFTWLVPEHWSLEDACTVPLVYLQINHILFTTDSKFKPSNPSIFVNSSDSFFKEACINIALHHNFNIFVTVSDDERAIFLRKFPTLNKSNLLNQFYYEYEIELKLSTGGKGVDMVINDNASPEHLEATLNCTRMFGFYTFIGKNNAIENETKFGMFMFLNNVTFKYMPSSNGFFLKLVPEFKVALHSRIECGIRNGAIKPLTREVCKRYGPIRTSQVTVKVKQIHKCIDFNDTAASTKWKNEVYFDDKHSYIIISSGKKIDLWFELLEWLISRGARKFMIAIDDQGIAPQFCDKVNHLLNKTKGCSITIKSIKIDTEEDAKNLIVEANRMQSLEAIFFVALDNGEVIFQAVDKASRLYSPVHYISLFSGGLKECEHRKRQKLPAVVIHSKNRINKFSSIATHMERFFDQRPIQDETCVYELVDNTFIEKSIQSDCLSQLLSNDLDTLELIGHRSTDELQFQEVVTLSRKYLSAKGTFPLFVIPGIDETFIRSLLRNLVYPAFCATFTEKCDSPLESARQLLKQVRKIQPEGPVSVLGDTWGGPVAIELASLLQADKRKVKTFLVEGSPFTWQQRIRTLGQVNTSEFDSNLLETVLNINLKDKINVNRNWRDVLIQILNESRKTPAEKRNIIKAVNGIKRRLITIATYTQPQERLKHVVLFKQVLLESCLEKYSVSNAVHLFKEDKYRDFLKNKDMAVSINKKVLFGWWK